MTTITKLALTDILLTEAGIPTTPATVKSFMNMLWFTPRSPVGLRLSSEGHRFLSTVLKLDHYTYKIVNTPDTLKVTLQMNKYLTCPYYLKGSSTIVLYGQMDSSMLGLMGGNLGQYLKNFTR